jgi:hypothetical protein
MKTRNTVMVVVSFLVLGALTSLVGCTSPGGLLITGSGNLVTKTLDLQDFTKLEIGSNFKVEVSQANTFSVNITVDDNIVDLMDVQKVGSTLHIGLKTGHSYVRVTNRAVINMPALRGVDVSGASRTNVSGFNANDELQAKASGASTLDFSSTKAGTTGFDVSGASKVTGALEIGNSNMKVSGASSVDLTGKASDISLDVSGASNARLENFTVRDANVTASGASSATINATGKLDVDVSGASRLYYLGNPTLGKVNVTGASTMSRK